MLTSPKGFFARFKMLFDKRKQNGASTLITAMLVVIVALAGTAVYAAVSSNTSHDGYALPRTTLKYEFSMSTTGDVTYLTSPTVLGYSDGYILDHSVIGESYVSAWSLTEELKGKSSTDIKVDVPGLGKTDGKYYDVTVDNVKAKVTTILHGMVYSLESDSSNLKLVSGDFKLGDYKAPGIGTVTLRATNGSSTLDLSCVSASTNGNYVFAFKGSDSYTFYYVGNSNRVPTDLGTRTTYEFSNSGHYATMTFANGALSSITVNNITYKV